MAFTHDLEQISELRERLLAQGQSVPQIVEAIVERFGVSRLKAHRLARGWTRRKAVDQILATYEADGLRPPKLTTQRLCAWEHNPRIRPGEDYLDRLCRMYETRSDLLGYGHDYSPPAEPNRQPANAAACGEGDGAPATYAGDQAASLVVAAGGNGGAGREAQLDGEETATDRDEFLRGAGATGLAALLDRAGKASARLSRKLELSNAGPVTVEQLQLQVASFVQAYDHATPRLFFEVFEQRQEVATLLDGTQPLGERRGLYRIAGQLSTLLGLLSFDLGDSPAARVHLLTAEQLAREVGDHTLTAWTRWIQSTVALWAGDFRMALDYAQDGQRYATGDLRARLAACGEARAHARMSDLDGVSDALRRAVRAMPSQSVSDDPGGWWVFIPAGLELYTGISLLWLGDPRQAEPYARQAIASYRAAPPALQCPPLEVQAQMNVAICMVRQDQPDEGLRLASDALKTEQGHVEANFQQASEFLAALKPAHRDLAIARDFAEQLRSIRAARPVLNES